MLTTIILVYTLVTNVLIAIFVYKNNPSSATNRIFGILGILISLWLIVLNITQNPAYNSTYLFWARISIFLAAPMSTAFFLLAHTIPHHQIKISKPKFFLIIITTLIVMLINISSYAFPGIEIVNGIPKPLVGPGMAPFGILSTFFSAAAVYILFKKSLFSGVNEKAQFRFITLGILLMLGLVIGTVFIPVVLLNMTTFVPLTPLYTILFLGTTAYAIIRHRFLDIRLILARTVGFLMFIFLCAASYVFILFVIAQRLLRLQVDFSTATAALLMAVFAAVTFQPLLARITHITNKLFFKGNYESNKLLSDLTKIMTQTIDLKYMTTSILNLLVKEMRLSKAAFLIIENHELTDVISINYKKNELIANTLEPLMMKNLKSKSNFIFEDLPEGALKSFFRKYDISIVIRIKVEHTNVALLVLGNKLSGEIYNARDLNLLNIFASESGIAIQHAKAYAKIRKFNLVLEKKVEERTKTLHEQNKEIGLLLKEKNKLLTQQANFLALSGHELRAPLSIAVLRANDMLSKNKEKDMEDDLEEMNKILKKLKDLMDKLFDVFQYDLNKISITPEKVNIFAFIEKLYHDSEQLMVGKNIKFTLQNKLSPHLTAIIDPLYIDKLMQNLISNAIKFTPASGKISLIAKQENSNLLFCISDNGAGVPDQTKKTIFEKFTSNHVMENPGIGLGLYIARNIAELHHGKIWVENNPGGGAIFYVKIPRGKIK